MNNISSLQIFNVFRFVSTLLIGILLTKLGLPTAEISIYELLIFLSTLVSFFWVMGGQNAFLQYFPKLDVATQKKALFNSFLLFVGLSLVAATTLWGLRNFFFEYFNKGEELSYLHLICWYIVFDTPAFLIHIYYLVLEKFKRLLVWGAFTFGGQLLAVITPIFLGYSLEMTFQVLLILSLLRFLWAMQILVKNAIFKIDFSFLKKYGLLIFPLLLQVLIGNSAQYIDGLIVQANATSDEAFAIFRWGARELPISLLFVGAVMTAMIPQVAKNQVAGLVLMKQKTDELSRWLFPLSMVLMLLSPLLFPIAYNADAVESARIFNVYLLILSSRILLPQVIIMSHEKNYFLVFSAIVEIVINVVLSLILVKYYGLVGIAFASVIAYLVDKILLVGYSHFVLNTPVTKYVSIGKYFFYNGLLLASYLVAETIYY
jgi:O-antigen/teichoic acid export membrane protein